MTATMTPLREPGTLATHVDGVPVYVIPPPRYPTVCAMYTSDDVAWLEVPSPSYPAFDAAQVEWAARAGLNGPTGDAARLVALAS